MTRDQLFVKMEKTPIFSFTKSFFKWPKYGFLSLHIIHFQLPAEKSNIR